MMRQHNNLKKIFFVWWNDADRTFSVKNRRYSRQEQLRNEQLLEQYEQSLTRKIKQTKGSYPQLRAQKEALISDLSGIVGSVFGFRDEELALVIAEPMLKGSWCFLKAARYFDPELALDDIFQAMRNVWIMNALQLLSGHTVELTPSVFAYSMLYPYTDNYLDDPQISRWEKLSFVDRFADRLAGKPVEPQNGHEQRIYAMVDLIEAEWDRTLYPEVYRSLLDIHHAQANSIQLIAGFSDISFEERLAISVEKGAASVVADGYLLAGRLSQQTEAFLYAYGAYLQLMDDLQDVDADLSEGVLTAFASVAREHPIDRMWQQVAAVGQKVVAQAGSLESDLVPRFQSLMQRSVELFLTDAVRTNHAYYTDEFVADVEPWFPLSPAFMQQKSSLLEALPAPMFEKLLQQAIAMSGKEEFAFLHKVVMRPEESPTGMRV
ncbi:class 1 isoprenoid biosynthesis enzyme [Mangrovibacterium marinum]|uniref:Uncharacterized protein n=1 Tax=Mangrovibacterium marinum TaxID=1639118 RepID=A0A2T5C4A3_9BACT|nr:class 1 isoprenoid biosynthesis enzyme [Mangrovibacterium marinum]PTN09631.1 hypothetical protein C8N47_104178 [Mangrovibacterium marinum]